VCRFAVGAPKALNYMQSVRALIVDDSSVMRKIVQRCLQQAGVELAEVREANNGTDALDIAAKNRLDLILCDINMPVMDGIEFVRRLKHIERAETFPSS
jgi:two-component system chemotaxis response regulator CheY